MTPLIWLVAMSLPLRGDSRPLSYYYPQAAVLIHDFAQRVSGDNDPLRAQSGFRIFTLSISGGQPNRRRFLRGDRGISNIGLVEKKEC
jgi:hypothetical protein